MASFAKHALEMATKTPVGTAAAACVVGAGIVAVAAPAAVYGPVLAVVGFTADGVAKYSIAAGLQATIGNIIGGSAFAVCQSAAAGGAGGAAVAGATQVAGGLMATAAGVGKWVLRRGKF